MLAAASPQPCREGGKTKLARVAFAHREERAVRRGALASVAARDGLEPARLGGGIGLEGRVGIAR